MTIEIADRYPATFTAQNNGQGQGDFDLIWKQRLEQECFQLQGSQTEAAVTDQGQLQDVHGEPVDKDCPIEQLPGVELSPVNVLEKSGHVQLPSPVDVHYRLMDVESDASRKVLSGDFPAVREAFPASRQVMAVSADSDEIEGVMRHKVIGNDPVDN